MRTLLLDAGNTRLKWAVAACDGQHTLWLDQGAAAYDALAELPGRWQQAGALAACHGVTVADQDANAAIQALLSTIPLPPHWLHATAAAGGVRNLYQPPGSLGADRWAALVGARQRTQNACLVVSAGTALTIDALFADGRYAGGVILPGRKAMRQALAQSTAQVGERYGTPREFPDNTADAVETGLLLAMTGAIAQMHQRLQRADQLPAACLLHGGDAAALASALPCDVQLTPNLVLEGVCILAQETT